MEESNITPWALDKMERKGVAKFLTKYINENKNIKVLNINSPWGSGKTFFLNNWLHEQKNERICVYFNAWENDFTGDAFISLVASLREQLKQIIGGPLENSEDAIKDFTKKASKALLAATPALAKGLIKKATGVDIGFVQEIFDSDALGDAAEKAVEKLIESNKDSLASVADFKTTFHNLITLANATLNPGGSNTSAFIFIDELDRCRPTFAIELLERIKHLFSIEDCTFIIATDTAQLGHAIRAVYGSGFGSDKYLKRFFDAEFSLDNGNLDSWVMTNFEIADNNVIADMGVLIEYSNSNQHIGFGDINITTPDIDTIISRKPKLNQHQIIFLALAKTFNSKLRELEKISSQIKAVQANSSKKEFYLFWAAYLIFLKGEAPDLYHAAINGEYKPALIEIREKYPAKKLYFGSDNISVHDIFEFYIDRFRGGEQSAKEKARGQHGGSIRYIEHGSQAFFNNFTILSSYPKLVDLAHSIE